MGLNSDKTFKVFCINMNITHNGNKQFEKQLKKIPTEKIKFENKDRKRKT